MTASHFCENLSTISGALKLSQTVSGVTLAALGNGANDLFSTFAAVRNRATSLALGELLGSAMFTTSCLLGIIFFIAPFQPPTAPFVRDTLGFLGALMLVLTLVLLKDTITIQAGIILVSYYIGYVTIVVVANQINRYLRRRRAAGANIQVADEDMTEDDEENAWMHAFSDDEVAATSSNDAVPTKNTTSRNTTAKPETTSPLISQPSPSKMTVNSDMEANDVTADEADEGAPLLLSVSDQSHKPAVDRFPGLEDDIEDANELLLPSFPITFKRAVRRKNRILDRKWSEALSVGSPDESGHHHNGSAVLNPVNTQWLEIKVANTFKGILPTSVLDSIRNTHSGSGNGSGTINRNDELPMPLTPRSSMQTKPKPITVYEALLPPEWSRWKSLTLFRKFWFGIRVLLFIMLRSTVPVVTRQEYEKGLNLVDNDGFAEMMDDYMEDDPLPFEEHDNLHPGRVTLSLLLAPLLISYTLYSKFSIVSLRYQKL